MKQINLAALIIAFTISGISTVTASDTTSSITETDDWGGDDWEEEEQSDLTVSHFVDMAYGSFIQDNQFTENNNSLSELRYRLDVSNYWGETLGSLKTDVIADDAINKVSIELREALLSFSAGNNSDIKIGRQILTWGTGDLVFLNDMFPKNWVAFFSGRAIEYLKAPSDAVKISYYNPKANIDIVWSPIFNSDTYLNGERFSFYNPLLGEVAAAPPLLTGREPSETINNGELAVRVHQNVRSIEWAMYAYRGFFKQPLSFDVRIARPSFSALQVLGGSAIAPLAGGLINAEFAWHNSLDDKQENNPYTPNSQLRYLIGFEKELVSRLTMNAQVYVENTLKYEQLIAHSASPESEAKEYRTLATVRLSYRAHQDKLNLSLFSYYSPSDHDHYLLPKASYRLSDKLYTELGANIFAGEKRNTFFGQLEDNSNIYTRFRYSI